MTLRSSVPIVASLGALLLQSSCASNVTSRAGTPDSWSAVEEEIRASTQASAAAWNRGDLPGHLAIYVDSVTFMTTSGPRPGVAAVEAAFQSTYFVGDRPRQSLRFESLQVRPLGEGAALSTGRFVLSGGGEPEQSGWFTLVWVPTDEGWRAIHDHSS